jgi:hypothetical protein
MSPEEYMWIDEKILPEPYKTIRTLIGGENAKKLIKLQGRCFYFNSLINLGQSPISEISAEVGRTNTKKLQAHYKDQMLYFNKVDYIIREQRDMRIFGEYTGLNIGQLCAEYNLTDRQLRNIINKERKKIPKNKNQISMFDLPKPN